MIFTISLSVLGNKFKLTMNSCDDDDNYDDDDDDATSCYGY